MNSAAFDVEQAVLNPARAFSAPQDVVRSVDLSLDQKIKILRAWEHDARLLMTATGENMTGGEQSNLRQVHEALRELGAGGSDET